MMCKQKIRHITLNIICYVKGYWLFALYTYGANRVLSLGNNDASLTFSNPSNCAVILSSPIASPPVWWHSVFKNRSVIVINLWR